MKMLRDTVEELSLTDREFVGDVFTWSNKGKNWPVILKRLDRFCAMRLLRNFFFNLKWIILTDIHLTIAQFVRKLILLLKFLRLVGLKDLLNLRKCGFSYAMCSGIVETWWSDSFAKYAWFCGGMQRIHSCDKKLWSKINNLGKKEDENFHRYWLAKSSLAGSLSFLTQKFS